MPQTPEPQPAPRSVLLGWSDLDAGETQRLIELLTAEDHYHRVPTRTDAYRYARRAVLLDMIGQRADFGDPSDPYLQEYLILLRRVQIMQQATPDDTESPSIETQDDSRDQRGTHPRKGGAK